MATQLADAATETYTTRTTCRSCEAKSLSPILSLGDQYIPNFVTHKDETLPKAPLDLVHCDDCGLLQLRHSVNPHLLWGKDYGYRSGINATMKHALQDVVYNGYQFHQRGVWLDIGANDGTLLSKVPRDFHRIGVEPTSSHQHLLTEHADEVVVEFFSADAIGGTQCDVITSCAMFYDLDDPNAFVADIATCLTDDGVWINQLSDLGSMIKSLAWDACCHEHRCYYTVENLKALYARHGLVIVGVRTNDINGGSIRVLAQKGNVVPESTRHVKAITRADVLEFAVRVDRWKTAMLELLDMPRFGGTNWCLGASTKGTVLLQHLGVADKFVAVGDRNPAKIGKYMVGSWLPITDEITLRRAKPDNVLVLPWSFRDEMLERESELRRGGTAFVFPMPDIAITL